MQTLIHSLPGRTLAVSLALFLATLGCRVGDLLDPGDGAPAWQQSGLVEVPGGWVQAAGGHLLVERRVLSVDTVMGTWQIAARYSSTAGRWHWSFQLAYDGETFVGPTGARHDVAALPDGAPVPGTVWSRVDADTVETRGGLRYHFDAEGRLSHVDWRSGDHPRITYAWSEGLLEVAACTWAPACLPVFEVELDAAGNPTRITGMRTGRVAELDHDAFGRLVTARSPLDVAEGRPGARYEYELAGTLLAAITSSEGERIEYAWQAGRRIRQVTRIGEGDPHHRFRFVARDGDGLYVTRHVNPLGAETRYAVDAERRVRRIVLEETGETLHFEWEGRRVVRATAPDGTETAFTWVDDEIETVFEPSGNEVRVTYQPGGVDFERPLAAAVARIEDTLGTLEVRRYDAEGRVVEVENGEGEVTSRSYGLGRTIASETAAGVTREFDLHGVHGHWLAASGAWPDARLFDPVGNERAAAAALRSGGVLTRGYDADRNLAEIRVAATAAGEVLSQDVVRIERRSDGRISRVTRPGGGDHVFLYDAHGRLVTRRERVDGVWRDTTFGYDAAGNRVSRTRPNGMREEREYDGYSRLVRRRSLRDGVLEAETVLTRANGRLFARSDSLRGGVEIHAYDEAGRTAQVIHPYGETVHTEYDLRSRPVRETWTLPEHGVIRTIERGYDLANRAVSLGVDGEELLHTTFEDGRPVALHTGGGLTRELLFDAESGLLSGTVTHDATGAQVADSSLLRRIQTAPPRDEMHSVVRTPLAVTEERHWLGVSGGTGIPEQLVGKRVFGWRDGAGGAASFAYDALSNRVDAGGESFGYNAERNRLELAVLEGGARVLDYTWDEAGYATSRGGIAITWNADGRLASHGDDHIDWDHQGRPLRITASGVTRDYTLFGGRVERDPDSGALIGSDFGEVYVAFGGARRYRHPDFRGNVSFVSDENGQILSHHRYGPYGLDAVFGAGGDVHFVGRSELGELMVLGERVYDPAVGRFLSPDPVFRMLNQYAYAMGNPVWFSDPDGRQESAAEVDVLIAVLGLGLQVVQRVVIALKLTFWISALSWAGIAFAIAVLIYALWRLHGSTGTVTMSGQDWTLSNLRLGVGGLSIGGGLAAASPGCAPTALVSVPDAGRWLLLLVPLQLLLALALLRRRRAWAGGRLRAG